MALRSQLRVRVGGNNEAISLRYGSPPPTPAEGPPFNTSSDGRQGEDGRNQSPPTQPLPLLASEDHFTSSLALALDFLSLGGENEAES